MSTAQGGGSFQASEPKAEDGWLSFINGQVILTNWLNDGLAG